MKNGGISEVRDEKDRGSERDYEDCEDDEYR